MIALTDSTKWGKNKKHSKKNMMIQLSELKLIKAINVYEKYMSCSIF